MQCRIRIPELRPTPDSQHALSTSISRSMHMAVDLLPRRFPVDFTPAQESFLLRSLPHCAAKLPMSSRRTARSAHHDARCATYKQAIQSARQRLACSGFPQCEAQHPPRVTRATAEQRRSWLSSLARSEDTPPGQRPPPRPCSYQTYRNGRPKSSVVRTSSVRPICAQSASSGLFASKPPALSSIGSVGSAL